MPYPAIPKAPSVLSDKRYPHHLEETPPLSNHQRIRTDKATTEYLIGPPFMTLAHKGAQLPITTVSSV